jgi:hypothetical protein
MPSRMATFGSYSTCTTQDAYFNFLIRTLFSTLRSDDNDVTSNILQTQLKGKVLPLQALEALRVVRG